MSEEKTDTSLDELLGAPALALPQLPPETLAALAFLRAEYRLTGFVETNLLIYRGLLAELSQGIRRGNVKPSRLQSLGVRLQESREKVSAAINELSTFAGDPQGWIDRHEKRK